MKEILEQLNARFEAEGGINTDAYHSVDINMTSPAKGFGGGLPVEFEITLCGYPEGAEPLEFGMQCNGYGATFEEALSDLTKSFEKAKQNHA